VELSDCTRDRRLERGTAERCVKGLLECSTPRVRDVTVLPGHAGTRSDSVRRHLSMGRQLIWRQFYQLSSWGRVGNARRAAKTYNQNCGPPVPQDTGRMAVAVFFAPIAQQKTAWQLRLYLRFVLFFVWLLPEEDIGGCRAISMVWDSAFWAPMVRLVLLGNRRHSQSGGGRNCSSRSGIHHRTLAKGNEISKRGR
jgi:hypothetical protein